MGNTILAHALYACNQVDFDLENFFGIGGNSHAIGMFNKSNLIAWHVAENPNQSVECVLQIVCDQWWEPLRLKMAYHKWFQAVPTTTNAEKFYAFDINALSEQRLLWQEFYQEYKDPSWPACDTYQNIVNLPVEIQEEINAVFVQANVEDTIKNDQFVEWLTQAYYDQFYNISVKPISSEKISLLGDYIQGNFDALIEICKENWNWNWNYDRSCIFHKKVLEVNNVYLEWLAKIKQSTQDVIDSKKISHDFELWEQALILAKTCELTQQLPRNLNRNHSGRINSIKSVYLENILTRKLHGKTI